MKEWENLKAALQRLWQVMVDKGYAGWLVWLLRMAEEKLAKA